MVLWVASEVVVFLLIQYFLQRPVQLSRIDHCRWC